jgi:hypothetical protein
MKLVAISYASPRYEAYQQIWALTAQRAGFDRVHRLGLGNLDSAFRESHAATLDHPRGAGYWLWKPYVLNQVLATVEEGDVVVYCDAAMHFVDSADRITTFMDGASLDLLLPGEGFVERQFTKRDAFVLMDCDSSRYTDTPQRFASFVAVRKTSFSVEILQEYFRYAADPRILTDQPNVAGSPDHPDFVDHRHDQSILSLLSKRHDVEVVPNRLVAEGLPEVSGQVINHTRTHHSPSEVVDHLLSVGILTGADLRTPGAESQLE